jgi:hypothetical protein
MTMWSTADALNGTPRLPRLETLRVWLGRAALALALILGARGLFLALEPPGQAIKAELLAAAADIDRLPWGAPPDTFSRAIERHFPRGVVIDPSGLPAYVAVTLPHLDKRACLDAEVAARRVEGPVVIALTGYAAAADCREDNDMTWRLMP